MTDTARQTKATRLRAIVIGTVVPIAVALVTVALLVSWMPQLPDPIAVHWSGAGPDGFGSAMPFILLPLGITVVFSAFAAVWSWRSTPSGRLTWNQKFLVVTSLWLAALLNVGIGGSVAIQRGLADAHDAQGVGPWFAVGVGAGFVLAVAGWFLLPPAERVGQAGTSPRPVDVQGQERVSWSRSARLGTVALVVVALTLVVAIGAVVVAAFASRGSGAFAIVVLVLVAALVATNTWWRVSADHRGFIARGVFGWPRKRIPLDDIRSVQVVEVDPTRDFGGWGWRWGGQGRTGIILRAGEGIEVTTTPGKHFVVTVDDAATGAGVLAALIAQRTR
ncbi:hypothetical protein GCM10022239_16700 [Leifsonia bigeumensis]|uniref:DUF1648 domain-containing protein n=1 Tax=Leifsonella bigeumensis TaxID=433643 RepID=A0ABP7FQG6_9MICO